MAPPAAEPSCHVLHVRPVTTGTMGLLGAGGEAVVRPGTVEGVTRIFCDADRMTYGQVHDLHVDTIDEVEYRLLVNNREYQRTLSRLQFLSGTASRLGRGIRLKIG